VKSLFVTFLFDCFTSKYFENSSPEETSFEIVVILCVFKFNNLIYRECWWRTRESSWCDL